MFFSGPMVWQQMFDDLGQYAASIRDGPEAGCQDNHWCHGRAGRFLVWSRCSVSLVATLMKWRALMANPLCQQVELEVQRALRSGQGLRAGAGTAQRYARPAHTQSLLRQY